LLVLRIHAYRVPIIETFKDIPKARQIEGFLGEGQKRGR
jgi:hypothetical protein